MWRNELTTTVEVTGIMGAGFLPNLLQQISKYAHDTFDRELPNGRRKQLITRFHLDNSALLKHDPVERERIMRLIAQKPKPGTPAWDDLVTSLRSSDTLFRKTIQDFPLPVDLAFRRGGSLQTYVLLNHPEWEVATIMRTERPHLQFFLSASLSVTTDSFTNNEELKTVLASDLESYCASPQEALREQEDWLGALRKMKGPLTCIERTTPDADFARHVVDRMRPTLAAHGCQLQEKVSVFISHVHEDHVFAQKLNDDLEAHGISCWYAPHDSEYGQKLYPQIKAAIEKQDRMLLILSSASMRSNWVKSEIALARRIEHGPKRPQLLFPISLVPFEALRQWEFFDADHGEDAAADLRAYLVPDFSQWQNPTHYTALFKKLLSALRKKNIHDS
jgi:hypothetical protein